MHETVVHLVAASTKSRSKGSPRKPIRTAERKAAAPLRAERHRNNAPRAHGFAARNPAVKSCDEIKYPCVPVVAAKLSIPATLIVNRCWTTP